jgi:hypothetical protein
MTLVRIKDTATGRITRAHKGLADFLIKHGRATLAEPPVDLQNTVYGPKAAGPEIQAGDTITHVALTDEAPAKKKRGRPPKKYETRELRAES